MNDTYVWKWCNAKEYAEKESVTEQLGATDQMAWVRRMNSIQDRVTETINFELIALLCY